MSDIKDGGPAFPFEGGGFYQPEPGMTLRDYFAGKALEGLLSDSKVKASTRAFARDSYALADAMLKAREMGA